MPIPQLSNNGLLPAGIHVTTLNEIRERFGTFHGSDRRVLLFGRLVQLSSELRQSGLFSALIVDGSFVTAKPAPADIDIIVIFHPNHDWAADLGPSDYALVSRTALRRRFGFDVFLAKAIGGAYERYVEFFGRVREDSSVRKGMLRITL